MKVNRFTAPARAAIAIGLLVLITGLFEAATSVVNETGDILSVDVISDPYNPSIQGIRLVVQSPGGGITSENIPSSYDTVIDNSPALALNPAGGLVAVWSRYDGYDFELAMARRSASTGWEPHVILTANTAFDTEARLLVDDTGAAHILWWGNGLGGPIYLQSFDLPSGQPRSSLQRPFEPPTTTSGRMLNTDVTGGSYAGGTEDPGVPTKNSQSKASANPCLSNPSAAPDHGVVMSCGRPAAWQVTSCQLVVAVLSTSTSTWSQTVADLSTVNMSGMTEQDLAQSIADSHCN
jgi:hypothetical protein